MVYNANAREATYKWRASHLQQWNDYRREKVNECYHRHKEEYNNKCQARRKYKAEALRLRNILIDI
jgi:hypothetical protein